MLVAVALRGAHVAGALDHEEPDGSRAQPPAVQQAARNHHVVAGAVGEVPERGLEDALALDHEGDLVALPVPVVERVLLPRPRHRDRDVGVEEQRHPVEHGARPGGEARGAEVPVPHHALRLRHPAEPADRPHALDRGGQPQVVEERRGPGEALVADELLVVERPVVLAEGDVALAGHAPQLLVDGHSALRVREAPILACPVTPRSGGPTGRRGIRRDAVRPRRPRLRSGSRGTGLLVLMRLYGLLRVGRPAGGYSSNWIGRMSPLTWRGTRPSCW